ncbi:hypothetical protein [Cronobacter turicensis]|uniref:hypothetical protein n=1 Tax=Cronobacter turicensis TaxID=413502 RepID=UPI0016474839|nr:hypothetical protein [Cronobacter turicensis]ELU8453247.1 hypothetical protein [Cronobacter turicensis]EMA1790063.1 hypothetical protein [Cronobacter turicensis]EMA1800127.1 hypothetical protein [Cronobacter turicensis]EMA1847340.1 hypothetical protein [Cronobacter turicensis]EMA1857585.1 hypothetical protein [Cronobacter turicensis]
MKYPIPDSEDIKWQQEMLREMDSNLEAVLDDFDLDSEVEGLLLDVRARLSSLREYSGC